MKREFKFRGKDSRTGEWLYGDLVHSADKKHRAILVSDRDCYDECEVQFDSIAQFTGFLDYHKEIYEGDILMLAGYICVVEWNSDVCAFCIRFIFEKKVGSKPLGSWLEECREWEVIGNIIDNPEFLNDANADLNTPNSGELKIQTIENVPFHAADRVKVIGSSTEAGKCFTGEVGEVIDIDSANHTCFVLFRKSQAWIQWSNLELYSKES